MICFDNAKSDRSTCRYNKCGLKIPKNSVRVGVPYTYQGKPILSWHHLECAVKEKLFDGLCIQDIGGYSTLEDTQKAEISVLTNTAEGVYVLRLHGADKSGEYYYVGKSTNIRNRLEQHYQGKFTAAWVAKQGGVLDVEAPLTPKEQVDSWEQKETVARMIKHGFDKVRGFEWTTCGSLSNLDIQLFRRSACGLFDLCRRCGNPGHFATNCSHQLTSWMQDKHIETNPVNEAESPPSEAESLPSEAESPLSEAESQLSESGSPLSEAGSQPSEAESPPSIETASVGFSPVVVPPIVKGSVYFKEIEASDEYGCLGDAISSLLSVPCQFIQRDKEITSASDRHDNSILQYGPDYYGKVFYIEHQRRASMFSHKCRAIVWMKCATVPKKEISSNSTCCLS